VTRIASSASQDFRFVISYFLRHSVVYPKLLRDRRFIEEVRRDGRFVDFLKHFGLIPAA